MWANGGFAGNTLNDHTYIIVSVYLLGFFEWFKHAETHNCTTVSELFVTLGGASGASANTAHARYVDLVSHNQLIVPTMNMPFSARHTRTQHIPISLQSADQTVRFLC